MSQHIEVIRQALDSIGLKYESAGAADAFFVQGTGPMGNMILSEI